MLSSVMSSLLLLFLIPTDAIDNVTNSIFMNDLRSAPNQLTRNNLITAAQAWTYNFSSNPHHSLDPGSVCNANAATFPTITGLGMTVAQLNLGPCAMLPPHLHRHTNLVVSVTGTTHTFMVQEDGADVVETQLAPGLMTVFPASSMHSMLNEGCTTNLLYSFLNGEDPGTLTAMNAFWKFGPDIGMRVLSVNISRGSWDSVGEQIPAFGNGAVSGYESCMRKCGLSGSNFGNRTGLVKII